MPAIYLKVFWVSVEYIYMWFLLRKFKQLVFNSVFGIVDLLNIYICKYIYMVVLAEKIQTASI